MNYLERSALIVEEMGRDVQLKRGQLVGKSLLTGFTTAGVYRSTILNKRLHVGVKEYLSPGDQSILETRIREELAFFDILSLNFPNLIPTLPAFYGLLIDNHGPRGIITEDFTKGGQYEVRT